VIVDSSALVAILRDEPEARSFARAIFESFDCRISAVNYVEASIVIDRSGDPVASQRVDELIDEAGISIESVSVAQARVARAAYRDFGKSSKSPAQLNLGDVFAYALAKTMREPLLYKGNSFAHTDIKSALDQS
jgi:ribonuclease VapC